MEATAHVVRVEEGVYRNWRAVGVLESLAADGDIARFLLALYSSQKQSSGTTQEPSNKRCAHCRYPLTLYCSVCRTAHLLPTPTPPPPPSLSSPSPPLPPQTLDTSTLQPAIPENASDSKKSAAYIKNQESTATACPPEEEVSVSKEEEGADCDDCSFELDIVKTESAASSSDHGSGLTRPMVSFRPAPSDTVGGVGAQKNRRRNADSVLDQGEKKNNSNQERKRRNLNTNKNKTSKKKRSDTKRTSTDGLVTISQTEDMKTATKEIASKFEERVELNRNNSEDRGTEAPSDGTPGNSSKERRKRKPCASHDLEDGHILPAGERSSAQIHVYDEGYFERHSLEGDPLRRSRRGKEKKQNEKLTKRAPKTRTRKNLKRQCVGSSSTSCENSSADEEAPDYHHDNIQNSHHSLTSCRENRNGNLQSQTNGSGLKQTVGVRDFEHGASAGTETREAVDPDISDKPPVKILVSAQKILPLRTMDGHYVRFLYSYFECAHCKKAFTHKRAFNSHIQAHVGQKHNNCMICEKGVKCSCDIVKHESRPTLQCEICGVHLKSLYALRFHIAAIHKNERPFKCGLCEKSFVLKTKLRSHMKYKHAEGGRLFHCDQCSYRAFDARGLKVHQMCVHFKERPFKCTYCPSAFAIKFYLDVHLRKHTGEKPFRCSECSQTFAQRPSLTRHRRNHHGLEPVSSSKTAGFSSPP
ncbi:hypothetical protein ACOMHN_042974 [Nucella lapillus]